jgi:hypothetical protein
MKIILNECNAIWIGGITEKRDLRGKDMFDRLGYNKRHFIEAVPNNDFNGCTKSNLKAYEYSLNLNGPSIVFEDDANTTEWYKESIEVPDDADVVYLGTSVMGMVDNWRLLSLNDLIFTKVPNIHSSYNEVYKVSNMLSAHAMLHITKRFREDTIPFMKYCINDLIAPDIIYAVRSKHFNVYACKYPFFYQDDNAHNHTPTITPIQTLIK